MVVFPRTTTVRQSAPPRNSQQEINLPITREEAPNPSKRRHQRYRQGICSIALGILLTLSIVTATFAQSCPLYPSPHQRIGYNVALDGDKGINYYDAAQLGGGWYHNYTSRQSPYRPGGIQYHQMVRASINRSQLPQLLDAKVHNNPGAVWILGNEPDRYGQDGLTAAEYASFYHDLYTYLRDADPTSRIAIAGVVQPTPIRLRYLDMVLASYQQQYGTPMPVDIWDIHNFILPENCSWGASIPPGLEAYRAEAVVCPDTLDDHGDITIFKEQIRSFRQWMNDRGFRNSPLIISEYGILLSKYHGYEYERVSEYMRGTFDYMLNATDAQLGYPADGNRLVQEFAWFSLNYWEYNIDANIGLNGNLFDHDSAQITPLGRDFAAYTNAVTVRTIDLAIQNIQLSATTVDANTPVTLTVDFVNQGGIAAEDVTVQFWDGNPKSGGRLLGTSETAAQVSTACHSPQQVSYQWFPTETGVHTIYAVLSATNLGQDLNDENNYAALPLIVENTEPTMTPTVTVTPGGPTATPTLIPTAPTATPTAPLPTATPTISPSNEVSMNIDPLRAGTLTLLTLDGARIRVLIPAGTVDQPTTLTLRSITMEPTLVRNLALTSRAFQLEAYQSGSPETTVHFATPIVLTLDYLDNDLKQFDEDELMLYTRNETTATWGRQTITLIHHDPAANQLVVSYRDGEPAPGTRRTFALFAPAAPTALETPTPPPLPTATPPISQLTEQIYLPLIQNN